MEITHQVQFHLHIENNSLCSQNTVNSEYAYVTNATFVTRPDVV